MTLDMTPAMAPTGPRPGAGPVPVDSTSQAGTVTSMNADLPTPDPALPEQTQTTEPTEHTRPDGSETASRPTAAPRRSGRGRKPHGAGARKRPSTEGSRRTRRPVAVLAVGAVLVGAGVTAAALTGGSRPAPVKAGPSVTLLAPADGDLKVGGVVIKQMVGSCDASSCYHVPPAKPSTVKAVTGGSIKLGAGQSNLFSVGAYNIDKRSQQVPMLVREGALHLQGVAPGTYQVTIAGQPKGGMWQFTLKVAKKRAEK